MNPSSTHFSRLLWLGAALTATLLTLAFLLATFKGRAAGKPLLNYGEISNFTLTNQEGRVVSLSDLEGKVWVADIIFTRCPGPCLKMTRQMTELQAAIPSKSQARFVTLTTDPDFDSPTVLKTYGKRFNADFSRWTFLTGTRQQVAAVATGSLKLAAIEKKPEERESSADLFVHSTIFVVVDKHARLRGVFETSGEEIDPVEVRHQIVSAVRRLERES